MVQVGWLGRQVKEVLSFLLQTQHDPMEEWYGGQGHLEELLELGVCACVSGFSCFLCVCFCCKLPTDVSSLATVNQLEVVIRCCQNYASCNFVFSLPLWATFPGL